MKKSFLLFALALAFSFSVSAANITVLATSFDDYGKGMACVVDNASNGAFQTLFQSSDFVTDHTDRSSAVKLLDFFSDADHGDCYRLPASGQGVISVPDRSEVYIVTVLLTPSGSRAYWKITSVNGSIEQVVTVP